MFFIQIDMSDNKQLQHFIERSDIGSLPVLHHTLQQLEAVLAKANFNYHSLDAILQYDPACMINLLAYANQEANKDFDQQISKVEHAAMFLGMDRLERFIHKITSIKSIKNKNIAARMNQLQYRGLHAAFQAQNFALLSNDDLPVSEIYTSALVSPLSELICWYLEPLKAQKVELLIHKENKEYELSQIAVFGFSYHELAEALTHHWKIPGLFLKRQETDSLEDMSKSVKCLYLAEKCSIIAEKGWYYNGMYKQILSCADSLHYSESRIARELHKTVINLARSSNEFFKIQSVSTYLALLPGEVPYAQVIDIGEMKKTSAAIKVESIDLIKTMSDIPGLIRITMDALYETHAFTRVAFLLLSKDKKYLRVKGLRGYQSKVFIETELAVQPSNLFSQLLTKPQSVLISSHNYRKFSPIINHTMRTMLDSQEFIARSVFSQNKPIGLFYMDKHPPDNNSASTSTMNRGDAEQMKKVCSLFEQQLKRISYINGVRVD